MGLDEVNIHSQCKNRNYPFKPLVCAVWSHAVICWEAALGTSWPIHFIPLPSPGLHDQFTLLDCSSSSLLPSPISLFIFTSPSLSSITFSTLFYPAWSRCLAGPVALQLPLSGQPLREINMFVSLSLNVFTWDRLLHLRYLTAFPWYSDCLLGLETKFEMTFFTICCGLYEDKYMLIISSILLNPLHHNHFLCLLYKTNICLCIKYIEAYFVHNCAFQVYSAILAI